MKVFKVYDEVYRREFRLLIGTIDEACRYLRRFEWGDKRIREFRKSSERANGLCGVGECGGIAVWMPEFSGTPAEISVLAHELMHAYMFVAEMFDLEVKGGTSHEMISYVEMLLRRFLEQLSRMLEKRKKAEADDEQK